MEYEIGIIFTIGGRLSEFANSNELGQSKRNTKCKVDSFCIL